MYGASHFPEVLMFSYACVIDPTSIFSRYFDRLLQVQAILDRTHQVNAEGRTLITMGWRGRDWWNGSALGMIR